MSRVLMDRYELGEVIGAGGAAKVHHGTDRTLQRCVAVKVLDDDAAQSADPASRDRFLNEARSAAGFSHPNVVSVFDAGEDDGLLFLVMEYVDGDTLRTMLSQRGHLPADEAVGITLQILDALDALHRSGVLHRDVKPANVVLDRNGRAKLIDFGIAKRLDDIEAALTSSGMVVGTPNYLAPEQAVGADLGPATDVYLTGVLLYEMLTGRRPPSAVHGAPASPPDPRTVRSDVPASLSRIVSTALAFDPGGRFPTAREMMDALRSATGGVPARPTPPAIASGDDTRHMSTTLAMPAEAWAPPDQDDTQLTPEPFLPAVRRRSSRRSSRVPAQALIAAAIVAMLIGGVLLVLAADDPLPTAGLAAAAENSPGDVAPTLPPDDGAGAPPEPVPTVPDAGGDEAAAPPAEPPPADPVDTFLTTLELDAKAYGKKGPSLRKDLDKIMRETDGEERAERIEELNEDLEEWVEDGEIDASVVPLVFALLTR